MWLNALGRERVLLLQSEKYFSGPVEVLKSARSFLLQSFSSTEVNIRRDGVLYQNSRVGDSRPPEEASTTLLKLYAPYNRQLAELLRTELPNADFNFSLWDIA